MEKLLYVTQLKKIKNKKKRIAMGAPHLLKGENARWLRVLHHGPTTCIFIVLFNPWEASAIISILQIKNIYNRINN